MPLVFLILYLAGQGITTLPGQDGTVAGVLLSEIKKPVRGVRVAAMAVPDSVEERAEGAVLAGISQTDLDGQYRLEGIPPGRYFIIAGSVDLPTFFPGTLDVTKGTVIQVAAGGVLTGIDFMFKEVSIRPTTSTAVRSFSIALQVAVEGSGSYVVPATSVPYLVLTRVADGKRTHTPFGTARFPIELTARDYRVTVENLPRGQTVKSLRFGTIDLMTDSVQLPPPAAVSSGATGVSTPINVVLSPDPSHR